MITLKEDSKMCPDCKVPLHFEQLQGMRIIRLERGVSGKPRYSARCPKCNTYFNVDAPTLRDWDDEE